MLCGSFKRKIGMDKNLQSILNILQQYPDMSADQKDIVLTNLKSVDKELQILAFKLDRTEKVKRTTAILLEETIEELELKRKAIEEALTELKATQTQLIQQEKLASLGQLTAGIAHEIKNPLNFVNNFSEVSIELIAEALEEKAKNKETRDESIIDDILKDINENLKKIHEHGTRANAIVNSMLQHSRGGSGKMEPAQLNEIVKEYVNLCFHGMRAGKNSINVDIQLDLDPEIKSIPLIKEDFSRVIINLCNNAFDAMRMNTAAENNNVETQNFASPQTQKTQKNQIPRIPKLTVRTKKTNDKIIIEIEDNGPGIPDDIKDKIMQPFFTTKKGTDGTGLGLSITYDIVKAHGGQLEILSQPGKTIFQIILNP
jgi:signal transduction histidine kinase